MIISIFGIAIKRSLNTFFTICLASAGLSLVAFFITGGMLIESIDENSVMIIQAVESYYAEHMDYPDDLDVLVPTQLAERPNIPLIFDSEKFYRLEPADYDANVLFLTYKKYFGAMCYYNFNKKKFHCDD